MISVGLIIPLVVAAVVAVVATATHRRLRPSVATPLLTGTIVAVVFAAAPAMLVVAVGYLAHLSVLSGMLAWCREALGLHQAIPVWIGLPAVAVLVAAVVRVRRVVRSWREFRRSQPGAPEVVRSESLFAYALPGAGGQIVVSSGLVGVLEPDELAVVLAHEHGHAVYRHDRHVMLADLADAVVPFVRPLRRRLMFVLERCADEAAVAAVGGDRRLVARTLARVALSRAHVPSPARPLAGLGVGARVDALLDPPTASRSGLWQAPMLIGIVSVLGAGAVQLHHLAPLLIALCPG
jgi:beta-lactamase regulating signal transducer with metallopeptidase domain